MMADREKTINDLADIGRWIAEWVGFERARNFLHTIDDAISLLKEQDAVVRCKDCKAWKQYDDMNLGECGLYPEYNKMGDWFCNFGERKESR